MKVSLPAPRQSVVHAPRITAGPRRTRWKHRKRPEPITLHQQRKRRCHNRPVLAAAIAQRKHERARTRRAAGVIGGGGQRAGPGFDLAGGGAGHVRRVYLPHIVFPSSISVALVVSLVPRVQIVHSMRPYMFPKLETNQRYNYNI